MGKTSLLLRIIDRANLLGYRTISLNLEQVESGILSNLNQFLRWLCANSARLLQLQPNLDDYWDEDFGSKISSTLYFQDYILESTDTPLVLALDEVNQIFEHPQVAKDFYLCYVLGMRKQKDYQFGKNCACLWFTQQKFMFLSISINLLLMWVFQFS